jgi:hypothetical protein
MRDLLRPGDKWVIAACGVLAVVALLILVVLLTGCTMAPGVPQPSQPWPDATTPAGFSEFNGGIIDNALVIGGHPYDTVTPAMASKVTAWQGNRNGFVTDPRPRFKGLTAIDKGVMLLYDFHRK